LTINYYFSVANYTFTQDMNWSRSVWLLER